MPGQQLQRLWYAAVQYISALRSNSRSRSSTKVSETYEAAHGSQLFGFCHHALTSLSTKSTREILYVLVFTDQVTKKMRHIPLRTLIASVAAVGSLDSYIYAYVSPRFVLKDNGSRILQSSSMQWFS